MSLPQGVGTAHLETKFENGLLEVTLPKVVS